MSTRVPEKLYGQRFEGMKVYYDNARLIKECDVVIICTPKHKNKIVFGSIREQYMKNVDSGKVRIWADFLITWVELYDYFSDWKYGE